VLGEETEVTGKQRKHPYTDIDLEKLISKKEKAIPNVYGH